MKLPNSLTAIPLAALAGFLATATSSNAQTVVFSEDWETDHSLDNTYATNNTAGCINLANLYFDYSTIGIPLSPSSTNSSTRALKMCANLSGSVFGGVSVSPLNFDVTSNFELRFDAWFNYNGPCPAGGNGSTQAGGGGYGTAGSVAQSAGVADSIFFSATGDANSSADYRAYSPAHNVSYQDGAYRIGSDNTGAVLGDPNSGFVYSGDLGSRNVIPNSTTGYYPTNFPGQSPPAAQTTLFAQQNGTAHNGAAGFKWRDFVIQKIGNTITWTMDGVLLATLDATDAGAPAGTKLVFNHYDINATSSSDANRTNLLFTLIDNVRVTEYTNVVIIAAPTPTAAEAGPANGVFTITRSAGGVPLTVNYAVIGNASNGVDYNDALGGPLSGSITFAPGDLTTNIVIVPVDDSDAEVTEAVTLSINPSTNYFGAGSATVIIADNETPRLAITNISSQVYERTNDYATFRITRLGDTNAASFSVNLSFPGVASFGTDFYTNNGATIDPGMQSVDYKVHPIVDAAYEGNETLTVGLAPAGGGQYTVGSPATASVTVVDANTATETILFSENFDVDHSANWTQFFASTNAVADFNADFNFAYTSFGIPEAPHGGGNGLFLNVNKDATGTAAAVNVYPNGQSFSGNYALRFDMFLSVPQPSTVATEHALAGINHAGTRTNWWRSGGVPAGWVFDGLFFAIETDNGSAPNYAAYSPPTTAGNNPTQRASQTAAAVASAFKSPPWLAANTPGNINAPSGVFATPIWADVEISQIGRIVSLRINNSTITSFSNSTASVSGNIMLGYLDAFDSVSPGQSYAVIDNVRVVQVAGLQIISLIDQGSAVDISFTFGLNDSPAAFRVRAASSVTGPYADVAATIVQTSPGAYRATIAKSGDVQFYRIRHN